MSKLLPAADPRQPLPGALPRLDYPTYQARVGEVANRLSLERLVPWARRARGADDTAAGKRPPADATIQARRHSRKTRNGARVVEKVRVLSVAGKAHVDLQIKMLGAIPEKVRGEFVTELANHARKFPSSGRYLRSLADDGNRWAQEILSRIGGER